MVRRLSASETALWKRVAATVRPLPGQAPPAPIPPEIRRIPAQFPPIVPTKPTANPPKSLRTRPPPVTAATLDGSWDHRLRRGKVTPDRVIDLHGYTLADAHTVLLTALDDATTDGARVILVITGKGRHDRPSRIKAELADWLGTGALRHRIAALRPAHPRHGGGGAHYLILRRTPAPRA